MRVKYVNHMGSDVSVCSAARISFGRETTELTERDKKLIAYLAKNGHWSPFAHPQISLKIECPIFVARQLFKSSVGGSINEQSRRYVNSEPTFYVPTKWREKPHKSIKQGSSNEEIVFLTNGKRIADEYQKCIDACETLYNSMIESGVCPEQARMALPLSLATAFIISGSLYYYARVFSQRTSAHAQKETRAIAYMIGGICRKLFPVSWGELTKVSAPT